MPKSKQNREEKKALKRKLNFEKNSRRLNLDIVKVSNDMENAILD